MSDLDNYEVKALRADAAAGEYSYDTPEFPVGHGETVTTYANGFGIWHARVDFPSPGYGPGYLRAHGDRIRAKARRAIRREILARERDGITLRPVRVHVSHNDLNHMNQMRSLTFAETNYETS
jgi:hypothetical protein